MASPLPPPFPFAAYAKQRGANRAANKKALWKGTLDLLQSIDLIERASFCAITLVGLVTLLDRQLSEAGYRETAYAAGLAEIEGFEPPAEIARPEPLQVVATGEPDAALRDMLATHGFKRMSDFGARPTIFMGQGLLGAWKPIQSHDVRVFKVDLPGGAIHGAGEAPGHGSAGVTADRLVGTPSAATETSPSTAGDGVTAEGSPALAPVVPIGSAGGRRDGADTDALPTLPYGLATITAPSTRADWRLHRASAPECEALMLSAIQAQGPIDLDNAVDAVRRGLKLGSVRANSRGRLAEALTRLLTSGAVLETPGAFFALPGQPFVARDRRDCDEKLRQVAALPPVEVAAAVCEELAAGNEHDAVVVVGAARRLGYRLKRPATHPALAQLIRRQLDALLASGVVARTKDGLALAAPPIDGACLAGIAVPGEAAQPDADRGAPDMGEDAASTSDDAPALARAA